MTWTPMLGVMVVVVMMTGRVRTDYPDNSGDLHLLERAINDTAAKLDLLQEEYSVVNAFVSANLNYLLMLVGQITGLISNSDSEDSELDNMIARVDNSRTSLEIQAGRVASELSTAKANNERYKQIWKDVDDLNAGNNYQTAKLQGMFELSDIIDDNIDTIVNELEDDVSSRIYTADLTTDLLASLINRQACQTFVSDVNLTSSTETGVLEGSTDVQLVDLINLPLGTLIPTVYCGLMGIASTINAPEPHGYGYAPSKREVSSFSLSCFLDSPGSLLVALTDLSQSNDDVNEVTMVTVGGKVCTFPDVLGVNLADPL